MVEKNEKKIADELHRACHGGQKKKRKINT